MKISTKTPLEQRQKIYRSLCYVLSERIGQVGWDEFTPADWDLFGQMAEREGVAPLMYWKLKDSPVKVQPSTFNFLRSTYYQTLAQNTLMYQELERILTALDEAGIKVIVLKGAALAATVYEDIGLRPMGDLDLLAREERFDAAAAVLESLGYIQDRPELVRGLNELIGFNVHFSCEEADKLKVELHWNVVAGENDKYSPSTEWIWASIENWEPDLKIYAGAVKNVFKIDPASHILYAAAHGMLQHGEIYLRLLWLYDIHLLLTKYGGSINWIKLRKYATEYQWIQAVIKTFHLLNKQFDTPVPQEFLSEFESGTKSTTRTNIVAYIGDPRIIDRWKKISSLNWKARLKYIFALWFPSPSHIRWRYKPAPKWLWPLYYPYRWFDILIGGAFSLLRGVFNYAVQKRM